MIHCADYLASRKCLTMDFDGYEQPKVELPDINTHILAFGKMKGSRIPEIVAIDKSYLFWAKENLTREPEATLIKNYLKEN